MFDYAEKEIKYRRELQQNDKENKEQMGESPEQSPRKGNETSFSPVEEEVEKEEEDHDMKAERIKKILEEELNNEIITQKEALVSMVDELLGSKQAQEILILKELEDKRLGIQRVIRSRMA